MLTPEPIRAVVVGASAGAIEALRVFLPGLPTDLAVPVVIVVHVPARHPSLLSELFQADTALPVREASDKDELCGGGVWFAPPDYHLLFERENVLALSIDEPVVFSRPSIDVLFESAAEVYGRAVLGVVLTGAGSDGAKGAARIRQHGGWVAVQSPETAMVASMPEAAIAAAKPQFVGSLNALVDFVIQLAHGSKV